MYFNRSTSAQRSATATTRIGGGDELKLSGEVADAARASNGDTPLFEGLPQRLEHMLLELRQLVEERPTRLRCHGSPCLTWSLG